MTKMIVFDMDGTIADFYGVDGWQEDLKNKSTRPYEIAKPMYDMSELIGLLLQARDMGYMIAVTTWLAKQADAEYKKAIAEVKKAWLKQFNFPYDEMHCVQYGTTKANCTRKKADYQILIDDNEQVRKGWTLGDTIDANKDIVEQLKIMIGIE